MQNQLLKDNSGGYSYSKDYLLLIAVMQILLMSYIGSFFIVIFPGCIMILESGVCYIYYIYSD